MLIKRAHCCGMVLTLLLLAGCDQYNFEFSRPSEDQSVLVTSNNEVRYADDPLEYRMQAADGRMVLWIYNPTQDPIDLLGNKSSVIDPDGISHPLTDALIAPQSAIKEIFPPLRPESESGSSSPVFSPISPIDPNDRPGYIPPSGYGDSAPPETSEQNPALYWDWNGEGEIQLNLAFRQGDHDFEHHFTIKKVKQ
jgi:hypothetical protein